MLCILLLSTVLLELRQMRDERLDLTDLFPLYKMEQGCILSKQGDLTLCLELELPEAFTLSTEDYENLHAG